MICYIQVPYPKLVSISVPTRQLFSHDSLIVRPINFRVSSDIPETKYDILGIFWGAVIFIIFIIKDRFYSIIHIFNSIMPTFNSWHLYISSILLYLSSNQLYPSPNEFKVYLNICWFGVPYLLGVFILRIYAQFLNDIL